MKRINPATGLPFKYGDVREDGFIFFHYRTTKIKQNGFFGEKWHSPKSFKNTKNASATWQRSNREKRSFDSLKWAKANPEKVTAQVAKRRSAKLNRTPKWANLNTINLWYRRAKLATLFMGEQYEVDHIIPLQGKFVSGLHIETNLQLLTKSENSSKSNLFD